MGNLVIQPSLSGGELTPALWARVDLALYQKSLKTCRNFVVQPYGGVKNRAGTKMICEVKDSSKAARLIPFSFNSSQTYVLEMGDGYLRVIRNGEQIYSKVADLTLHDNGVTYALGDMVKEWDVPYRSLQDGNIGHIPEDSPTWWEPVPVVVIGLDACWLYEIPTNYAEAELPLLKFTQSADVVTLVHSDHRPMQLARTAHDNWTLTEFAFKNGPFKETNTDLGSTIEASAASGRVTLTATKSIFASTDVGRLVYLEQKDFGTPWEVGKSITVGEIRRSDGKYYQAAGSGTTGTLRPTHQEDSWSDGGVTWVYLHSGWGIGRVVTYTSATEVDIDVYSRIPDSIVQGSVVGGSKTITAAVSTITGQLTVTSAGHGYSVGTTIQATVSLVYTGPDSFNGNESATVLCYVVDANTITVFWMPPYFETFISGTMVGITVNGVAAAPTYKWALGAWGGAEGWPSSVTYFQQRQIFAATPGSPRNLWASRTGDFLDFGKSNPIQDDDRITAVLASTRIDSIRYMHPMKNLVVLTEGQIWTASGGQESVLKPTNTSFEPESYHGVADLPVLGVGNTALFVQDKGQVVRDMAYDFASNSYAGSDLTAMAAHLTEGHQIVGWAYQEAPFRCVWMIRDDGVLLSMTYMRDQQVVGWARHDTDGLFEDVCVVSEGDEDRVYFLVNRTIGGVTKRYIERMETRLVTDIKDAFFVDCGLSFDGRNTSSSTISLSGGTNWDETETLTVTSPDPIFDISTTNDIGDQLTFTDETAGIVYRLTITGVSDWRVATAIPNRVIPAEYRSGRSDWAWARDTFSGLDHLEGKTVAVLADGSRQERKVVTSGRISISPPASRVHVGLPIQADLETLDLSVPGIETLLPKNKAIHSVTFLVHETQTLKAGRDFSHLLESKGRSTENYDQPINLTTGKVLIDIQTNWDKTANVCCRVDDPVPVSILAVIPNVTPGGF